MAKGAFSPSPCRNARLRFEVWEGCQPQEDLPIQKYAIAAAFSLALATPALAAQYYVALDSSTKQCQVVAQKPDGTSMKMVGSGAYKSEADAERAIQSLTECNS